MTDISDHKYECSGSMQASPRNPGETTREKRYGFSYGLKLNLLMIVILVRWQR